MYKILHIPTGTFIYILSTDLYETKNTFKTKSEAYWRLIYAINTYNENLEHYKKIAPEEIDYYSQGTEITYSEFQITKI